MDLEGYNKFIPYLLHRNAFIRERQRFRGARESFAGHESVESGGRESEPGSLAEKFGAAAIRGLRISFEPGDLPRAREVARLAARCAEIKRFCGPRRIFSCSTKLFVHVNSKL